MKKWEYKVVELETGTSYFESNSKIKRKEFNVLLNSLGENSWELVTMYSVVAVFKREKRKGSLEQICDDFLSS